MSSPPQPSPPPPATGPFALRTLLDNVPLNADGTSEDVKITCVDYLDHNLYVGTSAAELLHFVQIPFDSSDGNARPTFILASRLRPVFSEAHSAPVSARPGIQQILLLPKVGKACILCNWTVTFYSLPELSPVFGTTQVRNCNWIGGVDLNTLSVVRIGEEAGAVKNIDFSGTQDPSHGHIFARQLATPGELGHTQSIAATNETGLLRSNSSAQHRRSHSAASQQHHSHARSTSLGAFISGGAGMLGPRQGEEPVSRQPTPPSKPTSPRPPADTVSKPLPSTPGASSPAPSSPAPANAAVAPKPAPPFLKPHIVSPSAEEFLLVTGTSATDPAIGMFINLDGDPKGPTLGFDRYPREVVVDVGFTDSTVPKSPRLSMNEDEVDKYVLASMTRDSEEGIRHGLEIQRFDTNDDPGKHWLEAPLLEGQDRQSSWPLGIRALAGSDETICQELIDRLCQRRFEPFPNGDSGTSPFSPRSIDSRTATSLAQMSNERELFERDLEAEDEDLPEGWEANRNREEEDFVKRLAKARAGIAVWTGNHIWWAVRSPLLLQLEAKDRDAKNELEFLTLSYLRQQAGLLLLVNFLKAKGADAFSDAQAEELAHKLVDSSLDPRVVLSLVPGLRNEIVESRKGIWIFGGVRESAARYLQNEKVCGSPVPVGALDRQTLHFLRKFLSGWRLKKGFGSIADENDVFRTVDASLLLGTVRADLNDLVDRGVDCFDRAVDLLESYHRLFVLSRLYQSRKMAGEVLDTWRRIVEGETDAGGEFSDGEQRVREYLTKISNQGLVRTYGVWLANRDPKLGAQAPDAVRYYLEHLVFAKGSGEYVDELITYYLDVAVDALQSSAERRETFAATYEAYRALYPPPKPPYAQFLADNSAADDEVSQSRLRLLQLLSDVRGYDAAAARRRLASVPDELLVPEMIILDGREGNHENALRLLVHRLGDYDAAIRYCLRGGASLFGRQQQGPAMTAALATAAAATRDTAGGGDAQKQQPLAPVEQRRLFKALLGEFLRIDNLSDRLEQTSGLLERFGPWFDVVDVIGMIPDDWSVRLLAGFLEGRSRGWRRSATLRG
ncbi:unnamed protein product [Parascedosporium putredinis]|uniref:CNH domain-containing protein n=1 Tax=Parascedosporium putredinis TaxID=1442378 RepID=A0A9P1GZ15_9PEZI|nr:unnamed protein product [Parascedosporium putredinis]CAI7991326.1 unnamed protein product [Parascedosporium putredinis]